MASDIRWWRVAASLALTLTIFASALSLPLQRANENADQRSAGGTLLSQDIPLPSSDDLPDNAGQPDPATNNDQMFPPNMPAPPPGALNDGGPLPDGGEQPVHAEDLIPLQPVDQEAIGAPKGIPLPSPMFPPNMPAPPPGAMNDAPVQSEIPLPSENAAEKNIPLPPVDNGGQMFPPNMPPPPPGALADSAQAGVPLAESQKNAPLPPVNGGQMFPPNMPPPPPGAMADSPQASLPVTRSQKNIPILPANGGQMFPPNMPPPPPGAMADSAQAELPVTGIQKDFPAPPENSRQMFPPNMPPPPPGAMAEPIMNPAITPQKSSQSTAQITPAADGMPATNPGAAPVAPKNSGSMFPPNMPPPPPGAYASPMYRGAASQFAPAVPPSDAAVEPVYLTGQAVPAEANQAPGAQSTYIDPTDLADQQTANAGQEVPATGRSQWSPQVPQVPAATSAETSGNDATGESADRVVPPSGDESPESSEWSEGESESSEVDNIVTNKNTYESSEDSYEENDYSVGAEEERQGSEEESFSFLNFWNSDYESDESSEYEPSEPDSWKNQEGSEDSFGSFNWLLDSSDDEFGYGESEESEWESDESEWESSEEELFEEAIEEAIEKELEIEHDIVDAIDENNDDDSPVSNQDFMPAFEDDFSPSRSKLILYCIPGVILSVLVLLAWKNYSGKVRVVAISGDTDSKQYDWKSSSSTDEDRQPMLKQHEQDNY